MQAGRRGLGMRDKGTVMFAAPVGDVWGTTAAGEGWNNSGCPGWRQVPCTASIPPDHRLEELRGLKGPCAPGPPVKEARSSRQALKGPAKCTPRTRRGVGGSAVMSPGGFHCGNSAPRQEAGWLAKERGGAGTDAQGQRPERAPWAPLHPAYRTL